MTVMIMKSITLFCWLGIKKMEHGLLRTHGAMFGENRDTLESPTREALALSRIISLFHTWQHDFMTNLINEILF